MNWSVHKFSELDTQLLYDILQLRAEVFVVEQNCPYQDLDGKDMQSYHVCGYDENELVAYARIVKKGVSYSEEISIGRVIISLNHRGKRLGRQLMVESIRFVDNILGNQPIRISAQSHLNRFYSDLGFEFNGKEYLEDGIPHIEMLRK